VHVESEGGSVYRVAKEKASYLFVGITNGGGQRELESEKQ